jgi:hypothetical protein
MNKFNKFLNSTAIGRLYKVYGRMPNRIGIVTVNKLVYIVVETEDGYMEHDVSKALV